MEKGAAVHEKLPREFAELFQAKQAHNVSRADDPPTVGLAAFARAAIQGVPNPRHWRTEVFIDLEFCFVAHARWHCAFCIAAWVLLRLGVLGKSPRAGSIHVRMA